ncbi:MAG: hypothetical protein HY235_05375 [Acidobacteria bacterium]|nr:hypothetical protein [Acidobacteriota bacterium]
MQIESLCNTKKGNVKRYTLVEMHTARTGLNQTDNVNALSGGRRCHMHARICNFYKHTATASVVLLLAGGMYVRIGLGQAPVPGKKASITKPTGKAGEPQFKAIWEPINYKQDLKLTDVFFINEKSGWVTGAAGTILHTDDGGESWTAQLGGDPQAPEQELCCLQFLDANHGWAIRGGGTLLRTTDGRTWEQVADDAVRQYFGIVGKGYHFSSLTKGVNAYGNLSMTEDGGRTWKQIYTCKVKMEVDGLTRDVGCTLGVVDFPSPNTGYAAHEARIIVKTEDGGATWNALVGPQEPGDQRIYGLTFLDDRNGFAVRSGAKLFRTEDGGQSWRGVIASPGERILFSGPNVGWSFRGKLLNYTTDGGRRWTSREIGFPAEVNAFSLPTTQRAYAIGNHGMIYRYRIVPVEYSAKGMLAAPAMPAQ